LSNAACPLWTGVTAPRGGGEAVVTGDPVHGRAGQWSQRLLPRGAPGLECDPPVARYLLLGYRQPKAWPGHHPVLQLRPPLVPAGLTLKAVPPGNPAHRGVTGQRGLRVAGRAQEAAWTPRCPFPAVLRELATWAALDLQIGKLRLREIPPPAQSTISKEQGEVRHGGSRL
jgi:hypothetical protein